MNKRYDAIIIGSGAGGGTAAYRCAMEGMNVLLLEQGPRYNPSKDYPLEKRDWETTQHFDRLNPDSYISRSQHLGEKSAGLMSTMHGKLIKNALSTRFKYERATGIGGSTLRYQAETHRFPEHAFSMKSLYGIAEDWPITYKELEPYYQEAEELLGVAGDHNNPFKPPRGAFPMPAHPLGCPSQKIRKGAAKLGLSLIPNSLAIPIKPYRGRPACIYCRACGNGCVIGDKGSVDIAMIKPAEATGKVTIKTGARAVFIDVNKEGQAEAVVWKGPNGLEKSYGRVIVVSCGAIETPRLLLNSKSSQFPDGLSNTNGLVGAYLMSHLSVALMVYFDRPMKSYQGLPIDARIWDFSSPERLNKQGAGFVLGSMSAIEGIVSPFRFAYFVAPGWGKEHKTHMRQHYGAHSTIFGVAEHMPRKENAVKLSSVKDNNGMAKAEVSVKMQEDELSLLRLMIRECSGVAEATGVKPVGTFTSLDTMNAAHVAGTARMGLDRNNSVVNSFGQSHIVRNLFIADGSVLVTQGCGDSPSLTIIALALRTADHIVAEMKKGSFS